MEKKKKKEAEVFQPWFVNAQRAHAATQEENAGVEFNVPSQVGTRL